MSEETLSACKKNKVNLMEAYFQFQVVFKSVLVEQRDYNLSV